MPGESMSYNYLENYITQLQSKGRYSFTLRELESAFPKEKSALHMALGRLTRKQRVTRICKGFYIVIPAEYRASGVLPPSFFINDLMNHLNRAYYVGLISAAALHGAAHQQPQVFQVIIKPPQIRPIKTAGVKISFILKKNFPSSGIIQKKTDTGYINISNPVMTALDLVQFQRQSGGFARVLEILQELAETFNHFVLEQALQNTWPTTVLQRFGYVCEHFLNLTVYAEPVYSKLKPDKMHPTRLSLANSSRSGIIDKKWGIIKNDELGAAF